MVASTAAASSHRPNHHSSATSNHVSKVARCSSQAGHGHRIIMTPTTGVNATTARAKNAAAAITVGAEAGSTVVTTSAAIAIADAIAAARNVQGGFSARLNARYCAAASAAVDASSKTTLAATSEACRCNLSPLRFCLVWTTPRRVKASATRVFELCERPCIAAAAISAIAKRRKGSAPRSPAGGPTTLMARVVDREVR